MRWVKSRKGQSIIEYLVVAAAIIAVVLVLGPLISNRFNAMGNNAGTQMDTANTAITTTVGAFRQ